jgi:ketosteroid isomerase-like protein
VTQGEMAVVSTLVVYISENAANERQQSIKNRLTMALIREDGVWKIFHEHTSVPIQMEDFKGKFEPE